MPSRNGGVAPVITLASGHRRIVRLFSWLDGLMLCDASQSAAQDVSMGRTLARLGLALAKFSHPSKGDDALVWDIRQAPRTAPLAAKIADSKRRKIVEHVYETFAEKLAPLLPQMRAQVIHNDMNPDNVLVGQNDIDDVRGILDFGDMVHAPLVCDMAIGATYRWPREGHPLEPAARLLKAYDSIRPITDDEIELIPHLMRTRLAISVTLADWQAEQVPENRDYALRFNREFWQFLETLSALSRDDELRFLREHLERS
jgi:Ser/Thr protein kinase RdoA (MazF antagonist)